MQKTKLRAQLIASSLALAWLTPSTGLAYQPASLAEREAINAANTFDMRKAFLIMKAQVEKAQAAGNEIDVRQALAFLKDRDLIAGQAFIDITPKDLRTHICQQGFAQVMEDTARRLTSVYADVAPALVVAEKRGLVNAIQIKYGHAPDQACASMEAEPALEASLQAVKEAEERRLQAVKEVEEKRLQVARDEETREQKAERLKQAPRVMRQWTDKGFCMNYGEYLRGKDLSDEIGEGKQLLSLFAAESKRRRISVDHAAAKKEIIRIGMSECSLYASWGEPDSVNNSVGSWGVHKQHVYGNRDYVYTLNGRITSWQN